MDPPDRPGGLSPDVAGAVSVSRSDATRRTYSGQWRQFVAWADDAVIPWLPTAPVDVAEYLTALVGAGRRSCNGAARRCPSCPPGYVRQSEDRLCEPRSPRLDHRRNHPVRGVLATFAYWVSRAYDSSAMVKVRHRRVRFSTMSISPKHSLPWAYAVHPVCIKQDKEPWNREDDPA